MGNHKGPNKVLFQDDKIITFLIESKTYGNKEITIDKDDFYLIKNRRWVLSYYKKLDLFYMKNSSKFLHREILKTKGFNIKVDHISGNTFDNRKCNLRLSTQQTNTANQKIHKNNTSGFKGVSFAKNCNKWECYIKVNYKKITLGYFVNKIDAAKTYNEAAIKYFGEFAKLNEITN